MALPIYLAMTPWEFRNCQRPVHWGWMGCHFSSGDSGLTGIPEQLPDSALLILDDSIPMQGHDAALICRQLQQAADALSPKGILLDLQRPEQPQLCALLSMLHGKLPCPTAVSAQYARHWDGPILVPPVPPDMPVTKHLQPWHGRSVWLEVDCGCLELTLTKEGCQAAVQPIAFQDGMRKDQALHCHYRVRTEPGKAVFSLMRTPEDIQELLSAAEPLGVSMAVGLYQELFYLSTAAHRL